jgi:hypothetical protein
MRLQVHELRGQIGSQRTETEERLTYAGVGWSVRDEAHYLMARSVTNGKSKNLFHQH